MFISCTYAFYEEKTLSSHAQVFEPSAIAIVFMNTVNILNGIDALHYVLKRLSSFDLKVHFSFSKYESEEKVDQYQDFTFIALELQILKYIFNFQPETHELNSLCLL